MEGIKPFSWTTNMATITAGWSDGPQFKNPNLSPGMTIVSGIPSAVDEKLHAVTPTEGKVIDVWNQRRANGN